MPFRGVLLVVVLGLGLFPFGTSRLFSAADDSCEKEKIAVELAKAELAVAENAMNAAWDAVKVKEELIWALVAQRNTAQNTQRAKMNAWHGAVQRYMACESRPGDHDCSSEKAAMDSATDALNAAAAEVRRLQSEIDAQIEELKRLADAVIPLAEKVKQAADALKAAIAAVNACRNKPHAA